MKNYQHKVSVLPLILFILALALVYIGIYNISEGARKEQTYFLQKAVKRAAVQCYVIEGMYPPDIQYLEDHYGLIVDHKRYVVHYEVFGANVMPDVIVIPKAGGY